eukprot:scaffold100734_cov57-Phaeocystis_antarctica.AAC.2
MALAGQPLHARSRRPMSEGDLVSRRRSSCACLSRKRIASAPSQAYLDQACLDSRPSPLGRNGSSATPMRPCRKARQQRQWSSPAGSCMAPKSLKSQPHSPSLPTPARCRPQSQS